MNNITNNFSSKLIGNEPPNVITVPPSYVPNYYFDNTTKAMLTLSDQMFARSDQIFEKHEELRELTEENAKNQRGLEIN